MESLIKNNFTPARFHVQEQPDAFPRFGAEWTPTILVSDARGKEHHRIEGFLPKEDFMAQLRLGLAHEARARGEFDEAERHYRSLAAEAPEEIAAEALYWAGVSKYKSSNDGEALAETARLMNESHPDSVWMKKASVWSS